MMDGGGSSSSFSSFNSYLRALAATPAIFAPRAGSASTSFDEISRIRARSGSHMRRTLRWFHLIGLFTDLNILLNLVSIGTLFVFYMVANAVIYRRYVSADTKNPWPTLSFLLCFSLTSVIFTLVWQFVPRGKLKDFMLGASAVVAIAFLQLFHCMVPQARKPEFWGIPLMPWIPSISIFLNIFLLGSLDGPSYARFGFFTVLAVLVYILYSVHASFDAEGDGTLVLKNGEAPAKESNESEDQNLSV